jgi:hypothetical protein
MLFHYLKFSLFYLLSVLTIVALLAGQTWIVLSYLGVSLFIIAGDAWFGDDTSAPAFKHPHIFTAQLFAALPLLCVLMFVATWSVSAQDTLGFGQWFYATIGWDINQNKAATAFWQHCIAVFYVGLMVSMVGTVTAHELVHRTWHRPSVFVGRWLLAFSFDSSFSIEHVYGHHNNVARSHDPATAPRGRNVYRHIVISTLAGNKSAWRIENQRLKRRQQAVWSWHNQILRGAAMSLCLLFLSFGLGGLPGLLFFIACGLWAKALLEIVNYMEHYGLVRAEGEPVLPRHSWNTNKKMSSWAMFNLSRHSHHHAKGHIPFHQLQAMPQAPVMPTGYLGTIFLTLMPPLWFKVMTKKLKDWDDNFASETERRLLQRLE